MVLGQQAVAVEPVINGLHDHENSGDRRHLDASLAHHRRPLPDAGIPRPDTTQQPVHHEVYDERHNCQGQEDRE